MDSEASVVDQQVISRPIAMSISSGRFVIMANSDPDETYSKEETERRREAALKRMLATPHKPQEKLKKANSKSGRAARKH